MDSQENVNKLLEEGNLEKLEMVKDGFHYIRKLVSPYASKKDLIAIDYKSDFKSGVRLDPVYHFTNDGLMDKTVYYHNDKPVLQVEEEYQYNNTDAANDEMNLSKKAIYSRVKTWRYYFEDGTLDVSNKEGTFKIKEKFYRTPIETLTIGSKRRHNIQIIFSQRAGALLVIMGVFKDSREVEDAMRQISLQYSSNFTEYEKYGTENICDDILNDEKFSWLNTYIPSDVDLTNMVTAGHITSTQQAMMKGAFTAYDLTNIQGMTIRQYFVEKLKGNIK